MEVSHAQGYRELEARMRELGLFKRRYVYYLSYFVLLCIGVISSVFIITATDVVWIQALNAVFLAYLFVQAGVFSHDCMHGGVFASKRANNLVAQIVYGFLVGLSKTWWVSKHNMRHHAYPNQIGKDPDLGNPFAFSPKQLEGQSTFRRKVIKPYQHIIFFAFLFYVYFVFLFWSPIYAFAARNRNKGVYLELAAMALHWLVFGFFIFYFLPVQTALLFAFINIMVTTIYMRLIFAPNHKGEDMLGPDETFNWTHQITMTRNVRPSWLVNHLAGGLNFQIEHHLFPSMPRPAYKEARHIVKDYCARHGIRYHETTFFGSMEEIYRSLKEVSRLEI